MNFLQASRLLNFVRSNSLSNNALISRLAKASYVSGRDKKFSTSAHKKQKGSLDVSVDSSLEEA